ncbi:winged helix-turn-helix transcriptional regulator [Rathayibacter sp. VKM Ac-2801]|uniref:winged helix-turn-helix transcriptional regulator n=1 Tax=Rathayibacter sp. VKM Ac-2801 TaxID=2609255 RepID=UPI001320061D|nr:winged helix-turn-helix transcriptional regulator [Rathayibacter sp. VKM Ac-2801]QHC72165.1 hypothetical protein GSU45_15985 [Rathayibacter sp. VKM Ac-2801]
MVHREQFPTIPPRVEYRLTELGTSLLPPLRALLDWAQVNGAALLTERSKSRAT